MNFYSIVIDGYITTALVLVYFFIRDIRCGKKYFLGRHKIFIYTLIVILSVGIITAIDAHFVEPNIIKIKIQTITQKNLTAPIKIAFLADIQVGNHKKSAWVEKIVKKVEAQKPDLIILGGDQIDNEGTFDDETNYLDPLRVLAQKYPTYAVMGNHEYGIGEETRADPTKQTGDHSKWEIKKFNELGIKLLRNQTDCLIINQQKICLFGLDDLWGGKPDFDNLKICHPHPLRLSYSEASENKKQIINNSHMDSILRSGMTKTKDPSASPQDDNCVSAATPLIFITHNPDGILYWPKNLRTPDLTLAGHTHGGQVWLPFFGPMANAGIELPKKYYRGLNYYNGTPIYTSVGLGESGGAIRFFATPEITIINLKPPQ